MPLKLLSKKSWHVGNADNLARVQRDEASERARERALAAQQERATLALLQERAGIGGAPVSAELPAASAALPAASAAQPGAPGARASAAAGVRLGEGSLEVGGAGARAIHAYITSGRGAAAGGAGSSGAAAQCAAARDAAEKAREDPLVHIQRRLGPGSGVPRPAPKRPREEETACADSSAPSGVLERLRQERRAREAVEGAKARLLLRQ